MAAAGLVCQAAVAPEIEVLTEAKRAYLDHEQQVADTLKGKHSYDA